MSNILFRVPEGLLFGCMEYGWVVGWVGLGHGSKVFTLRWVGWVGSVVWGVGLDKLDPRTTLAHSKNLTVWLLN